MSERAVALSDRYLIMDAHAFLLNLASGRLLGSSVAFLPIISFQFCSRSRMDRQKCKYRFVELLGALEIREMAGSGDDHQLRPREFA